MKRWLVCGATGLVLMAGVGCATSDKGASTEQSDEVLMVRQSEVFAPRTLNDVALLANVVVGGTVRSVEPGPTAGQGEGAVGYMVATIDVDRVYRGAPQTREVSVLVTGFEPSTGTVKRVEGVHDLDPGESGVWFLHPSGLASASDSYFVSTTAGQILKAKDGTSLSGGEQEAAGRTCGLAWSELTEEVAKVVEQTPASDASQPELMAIMDRSPSDPEFKGNPCANDH